MQLRPYQDACLQAVKEHLEAGVTRQLVVQATGLGKAVQAATVPSYLSLPKNKRTLFLVARNELAYQAAEKFHTCNPGLRVGIEKAQYRADDADIVVASVQTLGNAQYEGEENEGFWEYSDRLKQFDPDDFAIIQADEAHHIPKSKQWCAVLRYMRVLKGDDSEDKTKLLIGWTATPDRADSIGLESHFQQITYNYGIREAIGDQWLAPILAYRVETEVDLSKVHTVAGDFSVPELTNAINTPERNELIARKYHEICPNTPALFFTTTVQHSHDLAESIRRHGYKVYPLSGSTPDTERKRFLRLFKEGEIHGLCSCAVLSEGVDLPNAEVGFMARPTKSGLLYRQQIGRILRLSPSPEDLVEMERRGEKPSHIKQSATVVDVCDVSGRHRLVVTSTLFGLRQKFNAKGGNILQQAIEVESLQESHPGLNLQDCDDIESVRRNLESVKTSLHKLDLLKPPQCPEALRNLSRFSWLEDSSNAYHLVLMNSNMLSIRENGLGQCDIYRHVKGIRTKLYAAKDLKEAVAMAEKEIPDADRKVMAADAGWRKEPPTEKQAGLLWTLDRKLRREFRTPQDLHLFAVQRFTAGDLSFSRGLVSNRIDSLRSARN